MPRRGRKAQAVPMLPHGLGLRLDAGTDEAPPSAEGPSIANSSPETNRSSATTATASEGTALATTNNHSIATRSTQPDPVQDISISQNVYRRFIIIKVPQPAPLEGDSESDKGLHTEVKTTEGQPELVNPEINPVQTIGRQLRPRKQGKNHGVSSTPAATTISAGESPKADGKADKENTPVAEDQELEPGISEPKLKKAKKPARKTKDNPYGLTPGESPFPGWPAPSAQQCEEVFGLLKKMHRNVVTQSPEVIPAPSLEVTGCGEVPSLLDGLIRTYLSGAVTMDSSNKMIQKLATRYGILKGGIGNGSIDWNNVRLSSQEDLYATIRDGGLATIKSTNIKGILDMVYQENIERRNAYLKERKTGAQADVLAAADKTDGQKDYEIQATEQNVLSLEYIRGLPVDEVMKHLTRYPGIGVKTSACVILFCLQMPCFAVDTHVHRFAKWLGWVPEKATPDDVFSHLEVRCPDRFKYGLHQLFIQHGKLCGKCKASTIEGTKDWAALAECPLESLLRRLGKRQSKAQPPSKKVKQMNKTDEDVKDEGDMEYVDEENE
ncbi:DNA glycosylase [Jackrogersella minutella]|nr:DNA glycosylase [Jackrogersella minutella]